MAFCIFCLKKKRFARWMWPISCHTNVCQTYLICGWSQGDWPFHKLGYRILFILKKTSKRVCHLGILFYKKGDLFTESMWPTYWHIHICQAYPIWTRGQGDRPFHELGVKMLCTLKKNLKKCHFSHFSNFFCKKRRFARPTTKIINYVSMHVR